MEDAYTEADLFSLVAIKVLRTVHLVSKQDNALGLRYLTICLNFCSG